MEQSTARLFRLILLFVVLVQQYRHCQAVVACSRNEDCVRTLLEGSECMDGFCSNPFHNGGCLQRLVPGWDKVRTCHSDDPPSAVEQGYCQQSPFDYAEVRISSQDWETATFGAWMMQILLSELLGVPASIETGTPDVNVDFYNIQSSFGYGVSYDMSSLARGARIGDCRKLERTQNQSTYQACSHVFPEVWNEDLIKAYVVDDLLIGNIEDIVESSPSIGAVAEQHWYIPRFAAAQDVSLLSYYGLHGEENRRKLAETFLRPTKWKDYCQLVSNNNCTLRDDVASRGPLDSNEENSFFVQGEYTGYFRATEKNDCDQNPLTCTGHIVDYPCGWAGYVKQQTYHLGIALESDGDEPSDGYTYSQMIQIWRAANETKSNVMMIWWPLSPLYEEFFGTEAEFTPVTLTPPNETCLNSRVSRKDRCSNSTEVQVGKPEGACDYPTHTLRKVIGKSLQTLSNDPMIPEEFWSPAYQAIQNYRITDFQLGDILNAWQAMKVDPWNHDPREATCRWVVKHMDMIQTFIPDSYPRVLQVYGDSHWDHVIPALAIAALLVVVVVICAVVAFVRRGENVIYHTQLELILLILGGFFLTNLGALVLVLPPSDTGCAFVPWLTNIGYCLVFAPLLMKVDAINSLNTSGNQMRRVRLSNRTLFGSAMMTAFAVSIFLSAWSIVDPLKNDIDYVLLDNTNENGETMVQVIEYCASDKQLWPILGVAWQILMLMYALALAIMVSRVHDDFNDTRTLRLLFFSLFVFVCLRFSIVVKGESMNVSKFITFLSLTYSIDASFALMIFVIPKLLGASSEEEESDGPLPELFLETTIMVANITGFTAWSSAREPNQVFKLLETIFASFDRIAERRKVFKVETVGDSYVAATGIPQPRTDHAVAMASFASECMLLFNGLTKELERQFGPDTGELSLRIGLNSGPVTGGYLKGKRARFQLFGDTMSMTGLMENTCGRGNIHVSADTAELLIKAKRERWLEKRKDKICSKYKGSIQTYWLIKFKNKAEASRFDMSSYYAGGCGKACEEGSVEEQLTKRKERLIEWNVKVLHGLLKQIVARREAAARITEDKSKSFSILSDPDETLSCIFGTGKLPLEQVAEVIYLPEFNSKVAKRQKDSESIEIPENVLSQLKDFVERIAHMYNDNPFHNFYHASHVVLAVTKLMNRIVAPTDADLGEENERRVSRKLVASALHDHTYGITSDPLTQFACVFAALIHDVDHPGVPNPELMKEDETLAEEYNFRSVAEQNAFELSWNVLMEHKFAELVRTICGNKSGQIRFRELVINSVMATDLEDEELKTLRQNRWEKAFNVNDDDMLTLSGVREAVNRKATIVLEHLIQAANVSHTMQHWKIYREWNGKLFKEMNDAYRHNRTKKNPVDYWYQGELDFFDHYVIPLSKKLSNCGVFGVSSDEFFNYARKNRAHWAARGKDIVVKMAESYEASHSPATHFIKKIYN